MSYKDSGVDITAGDDLVKRIKPLARGTSRVGVIGGIGGFGGLFRINELKYVGREGRLQSYKDPVIVERASGVGAKLKIAIESSLYDTIGTDLVAMCTNDVLATGAQPFAFLDYVACGKLFVPVVAEIVKGIAEGCRATNSALLGGETAEMPSLFTPGSYDLAGYSVGCLEHGNELPRSSDVKEGDVIVGLPSNGLHCAGAEVVYELMKGLKLNYSDVAPFSDKKLTYGTIDCFLSIPLVIDYDFVAAREFLRPSRLYATEVLPLIYTGAVKAAAHIANGGIVESLAAAVPNGFAAEIDALSWSVPAVFGWLAAQDNKLTAETIANTFNCGIGFALVVDGTSQEWKKIKGATQIGMQPDGKNILREWYNDDFEFSRQNCEKTRQR